MYILSRCFLLSVHLITRLHTNIQTYVYTYVYTNPLTNTPVVIQVNKDKGIQKWNIMEVDTTQTEQMDEAYKRQEIEKYLIREMLSPFISLHSLSRKQKGPHLHYQTFHWKQVPGPCTDKTPTPPFYIHSHIQQRGT